MGDSKLSDFINFAPRHVKIKLGVLFASSTLVVTVTLFSLSFIWKGYKGPEVLKPVHQPERETASHSHEDSIKTYEIKGISVGFMDKKDARMGYSQFTLIFTCPNEACKKNLLLHHAKVLDTVFEVGSEFYIEDFNHPDAAKGFSRFKSKIKEELSKKFATLSPSDVSIQDWFMK